VRIPIRLKLTAALAVPMIALVGGAYYEVDQASDVADAADLETELAVAALGPGSLVTELQTERNWSGVDQIGMLDQIELPVTSLEEARANTDRAWHELEAFVARSGPEVRAHFTDGLAAMAGLAAIRADIDSSTREKGLTNAEFANSVFNRFSDIIAVLLDDTSDIALDIDDATLRTGVEIVDLGTREYEVRANTVRYILLPLLTGTSGVPAQLTVADLVAVVEDMDQRLLDRSVAPYTGIPEFAVNDPRTIREDELFAEFVNTGGVDILALAAEISAPADQGFLGMRTQAANQLEARADAIVTGAEEERRDVLALASGVVLIALILTWLASRSITRPLKSLTRQARAMADERLPQAVEQVLETPLGEDVVVPEVEPIRVETRDEVADVAKVLNVVQERALDLAVSQAVLRRNIADSFVNLGRRNQNLVGRQLDFITELEREEHDPDTLESLFRLDHLATRMRRNAESLLRLAGGEPSSAWDGPLTILDVVRGALGEIEDYTRVELRHVESAAVGAGVAADLSHALAELLENALSYSPPGEPVEVRGRRTPDGYLLAIIDNGVGMSEEDLAQANTRLAGEESFTVAPSKYLGHYVAGHLTSRLGIKVHLQSGAADGVTARVEIPASLLVDDEHAAPQAMPMPAAPMPVPVYEPDHDGDRGEEASSDSATPATPMSLPPLQSRLSPAMPKPVDEPWPAPWSDDEVDAKPTSPATTSEPEPDLHPANGTSNGSKISYGIFGRLATSEEPEFTEGSGFGGLAPVPTSNGDATDGDRTPSGLVRRVPGTQPPPAATPFAQPMPSLMRARDDAPAPNSSAEEVSNFLADFALGVDRGLADAAETDPHDSRENW
jgi:signal transduction histidine kinase